MPPTHERKVSNLQDLLATGFKEGKPIRLKRVSTNSTRSKSDSETGNLILDLSNFDKVLAINVEEKWIDVEPGVAIDVLVAATLKENLVPLVVPEFPGITVGGAIQGGALESSSFKYGQMNDTVLEYELLLGDGEKVIATAHNEYADLYWGIATSYGSLAILTRIRLPLIPAKKYVEITMLPSRSARNCVDTVLATASNNNADFVEGLIFSEDFGVVVVGNLIDTKSSYIRRFGRNIDPWYYRFIRGHSGEKRKITIPFVDYLFRYDKGAFWMGEYLFPLFFLSSNPLTRFLFAPFLRTRKLYDGLHALNIQHKYLIQDVYVSQKNISKVLDFNTTDPQIYPVWLCPIKASVPPQKLSSHYRDSEQMLLNIGLYGISKKRSAVETTKTLETLLPDFGDRKMLYAQTFWSKEDFWKQYDYSWYASLQTKYKATSFKDVWTKTHSADIPAKSRTFAGILQMIGETLKGKNVVWK